MSFKFYNSYQFRIALSFLAIIATTILVFIGYNYYKLKSKNLHDIATRVYHLESSFSNNERNLQSFLLYGYKSHSFFTDKKEQNIDNFIKNISILNKKFQDLILDLNDNNIKISDSFKQDIAYKFKKLDTLSIFLKNQRYKLGFKDFGTIGKMRSVAHKIEAENRIKKEHILQLRRHEKNFLLRSEMAYIKQFNNLASKLVNSNGIDPETAQSLLLYKQTFNEMAQLYSSIGNTNNSGVYGKIFSLNKEIKTEIQSLEAIAQDEVLKKNLVISRYVIIAFTFIVLFIAVVIVLLSRVLTRDIQKLQSSMQRFIKSGFKDYDDPYTKKSKILEINFLYKAYDLLKKNLLKNIDSLKMTIEELERTTAYKSSFLANMSHEIRTPLNGIIGILSLLNESQLNNKQVKLLEVANYSSSHLLDLINLILDYSKISEGKMEIELRDINLKKDFNKLIKIFKFQANEKGIDLNYTFNRSDDASKYVSGDSVRINQIIINLLNNAIKFTNSGWVKLEVKQHKLNNDFDIFNIFVEDTGIGIEKEKSEKIFMAFEQEDISTTRKFGGTGLGLTISNNLAKLMDSELKYKPSNHKGSCFYFSLKLKRTKAPATSKNQINLITPIQKTDSQRQVLIVDDNKMNLKVLGLMLAKFEFEIDYAENGLEAISAFETKNYDMIFMDIQMPIMDGLEATKKIKNSEKYSTNPFPVIAVSASTYTDDRQKAHHAGIDDFISKPIEVKKLQNLLIKYSLNPLTYSQK